jgi:hypothetical protein
MAVDRGELSGIFCLTCNVSFKVFCFALRWISSLPSLSNRRVDETKTSESEDEVDKYSKWCLLKCWIMFVVLSDLYYDSTNPADSLFFKFRLPGISVIGWPICFQTNDLYDFGGLDKLPRNFLCILCWQGFIWDRPCKYDVLRNRALWLAKIQYCFPSLPQHTQRCVCVCVCVCLLLWYIITAQSLYKLDRYEYWWNKESIIHLLSALSRRPVYNRYEASGVKYKVRFSCDTDILHMYFTN